MRRLLSLLNFPIVFNLITNGLANFTRAIMLCPLSNIQLH